MKEKTSEEDLFSSLPRVLREEILLFMGELEEISRARLVCKSFKETVDNSSRNEMVEIKMKRESFEKKKEERIEAERRIEEDRKERVSTNRVSFKNPFLLKKLASKTKI